MNEDNKSFIKDMLASEGWKIFNQMNEQAVRNYREMATQPPEALNSEMRTWYSGLAQGREEALKQFDNLL